MRVNWLVRLFGIEAYIARTPSYPRSWNEERVAGGYMLELGRLCFMLCRTPTEAERRGTLPST